MNIYKNGLLLVLCTIIASFSIMLGRALGLVGLLLPPLMVLGAYLLIYKIVDELEKWSERHFPPYSNSH